MMRDIIEFIAQSYQFAVKPQIPPNIPPFMIPIFVFQSGQFVIGDEKLPIIQLAVIQNGDIVTASTTEVADRILDDFMSRMDSNFGYRFGEAVEKTRSYMSSFVVEFDKPLEEKISALKRFEEILNGASIRSEPFKIKRLAFGSGDIQQLQSISSIDEMKKSDFFIERRVGEPYARNRYFCSAPMKTADHVKLLELIERELS